MKTNSILIVTLFCSLVAFAADDVKPRVNRGELRRQSQMRRYGGYVMTPNSYKGKIVFANATGRYTNEIETVIKGLKRQLPINLSVITSEKPNIASIDNLTKKIDAEGVVFITDDQTLPPLLTAPESRWSIVNVSGLCVGASDDVASRRIRCELARGYAYLAGAAASTFENSVMKAITSPEQLDKVADELPPLEVVARFMPYLEQLGVTQKMLVPYSQACEEGWASQPTNEYQKAIWDKIHQPPKNPMKIEFDPKKGR